METNITISPVAWSGDSVTKYMAKVTFDEVEGKFMRRRSICGDPKQSEIEAVEALYTELDNWSKRLKEANKALKKSKNELISKVREAKAQAKAEKEAKKAEKAAKKSKKKEVKDE